jgi:hypothetical protein
MKVKVNGQGKILTPEELRLLFTDGLTNPRDRALFAICLFTGPRHNQLRNSLTKSHPNNETRCKELLICIKFWLFEWS